jgi:hypothetical protein
MMGNQEVRSHLKRNVWCSLLTASILTVSLSYAAERPGVLSLRRFELLDRLSPTDQSSQANFHLRGILDGLAFANTPLESSGKGRLFCANVSPDIPKLRAMLREQIELLAKIGQSTEQAMERTGAVAIILQKLR